jgi:hypothetical protein
MMGGNLFNCNIWKWLRIVWLSVSLCLRHPPLPHTTHTLCIVFKLTVHGEMPTNSQWHWCKREKYDVEFLLNWNKFIPLENVLAGTICQLHPRHCYIYSCVYKALAYRFFFLWFPSLSYYLQNGQKRKDSNG